MKKLICAFSLVLIFVLMLSLPTLAAGSESWDAYIAYAEQVIREKEEADFVDMALSTLLTESNEADPDGWPFDMFVANRGLFVSYNEFMDTIYVPETASAEPAEVTAEGFDAYVAYLRSYMEAYSDPKIDDAGKQMALGELDTVAFGDDVTAFPFEMFVNEFAAMTYDEFMATQTTASGEASAEPVEVTNETFGSYVSYLRKYMEEYSDPKIDDAGKQMALGELDTVDVGSDVYAFPFDMFVNEFAAMTFDEFILSKNTAASVEPETEADFNAYVQYIRDYMTTYNGEGAKEGFDEAGKQMALGELDNVAFGSSVNGFPFEMFVNEFGVATYEEFLAAK